LTALSQAEAKGGTRHILASLGLHLMQRCQYLMLSFLLKSIFLEGIDKNKDCHQCRIIIFLKISFLNGLNW
jgi:hypothetical protein